MGKEKGEMNDYREEDEGFRVYLEQVRRIKLLTREEEAERARLSAAGDGEARDALILSNLRYVVAVALMYRRRCRLPLLQLINEGNMGLVKAASKYDAARGHRFISYAKWWVKYYILRAITDHYTGGIAARRDDPRFAGAGESGGDEESARKPPRLFCPLSLEHLLSEETDPDKSEYLVDRREGSSPAGAALDRNLRDIINDALARLKPIEREVVVRHFGLNGEKPASMGEIGKSYNLTKERIRQIEGTALGKMKYPMLKRRASDFILT